MHRREAPLPAVVLKLVVDREINTCDCENWGRIRGIMRGGNFFNDLIFHSNFLCHKL